MARQIFIVDAHIVDANGTFNYLSGYPKAFDSKNYSGDVDKANKRAVGDFSERKGEMCKRDDRQKQAVILSTVDGFQLDKWTDGDFVEAEPESLS